MTKTADAMRNVEDERETVYVLIQLDADAPDSAVCGVFSTRANARAEKEDMEYHGHSCEIEEWEIDDPEDSASPEASQNEGGISE